MTELAQRLQALGLRRSADSLDDTIALATKKRMSPVQLFEHMCGIEEADRAQRSLERRTARSRLGRFKPIADFDWNWPREIDRDAVERTLTLDFLADARNVVLVASQGLGKTMIAQNIAHQAVLAGHSVLFVTAAQLLLDLGGQESARALDRRFKHYARVGLLCIDELGYLGYDNRAADLLFQLVNLRYEKKSLVLTTNLVFADWHSVFPSATCATALIDRLIHHADVLKIEGDSFRLREAKAAAEAKAKTSRTRSPKR